MLNDLTNLRIDIININIPVFYPDCHNQIELFWQVFNLKNNQLSLDQI